MTTSDLEALNERWRKLGLPYANELEEGGFQVSCPECTQVFDQVHPGLISAMNTALTHRATTHPEEID